MKKCTPNLLPINGPCTPNLTPAETRLRVLETPGLNTQEMANMLGISKKNMHQACQRQRCKVGGVTS